MALTYSVIAYIVTKTFSATIDTNAHIRFLLLRCIFSHMGAAQQPLTKY